MFLSNWKKKGKFFRNPFRSSKSTSAASTNLQPTSGIINTPLTPHSDVSTTINVVSVASGSGIETIQKSQRNSIQNDPRRATLTSSRRTSIVSTSLAPIATCNGLTYVSFCDSPFLLFLVYLYLAFFTLPR